MKKFRPKDKHLIQAIKFNGTMKQARELHEHFPDQILTMESDFTDSYKLRLCSKDNTRISEVNKDDWIVQEDIGKHKDVIYIVSEKTMKQHYEEYND